MIVLTVLDCNNICNSDVDLQKEDLSLRCFKWWMMCCDHENNDDLRCLAIIGCSSKMFQAQARVMLCSPALAHGVYMDCALVSHARLIL